MPSLQSAAFTFLVPAGCVFDPPGRAGLASFTCEMMLRGAGERDGRQFILDLDNLGVERQRRGFRRPRQLQRGHGGGEPAARPGHLRRPAPPPPPARRAVGIVPAGGLAGPAGRGGRAGGEGDDRASPPPLSLALGTAFAGRTKRRSNRRPLDDIRGFFRRQVMPNGTILGVAGRIDWEPLRELVGSLLRRLGSRASRRRSSKSRRGADTSTSPTTRTRRRSASPTTACPTGIPTIFRPGAPSACSAAA